MVKVKLRNKKLLEGIEDQLNIDKEKIKYHNTIQSLWDKLYNKKIINIKILYQIQIMLYQYHKWMCQLQ